MALILHASKVTLKILQARFQQYVNRELPDVQAGFRPRRPWDSPGKNTGVGCHFLLQGIFPSQGLNSGLPHCRQTLYPLSHRLRWVQLCGSFSILWPCLSLGLEWKLTFSSPVATAEFSKFADMLSVALSQHHLLEFEVAQLEFHHLH